MENEEVFQTLYQIYYPRGVDLSAFFCAENPGISHLGLKKIVALKFVASCKSHWLTILGIDVICGYYDKHPSFYVPCWYLMNIEGEKMYDRFIRSINEAIDYINGFSNDSFLFCITVAQE